MSNNNTTLTMPLKRKKAGRTNYRKRLALLKSGLPRLVVRKSNSNIRVQVVEYHQDGDIIIVSAHSRELSKLGWPYSKKSVPAAYLTGLLAGKKAQQKNLTEVTVDFGMQAATKGSKLYAAVKGAADAGVKPHFSTEVLPDEKRIMGEHIASFAKKFSENKEKYGKQFAKEVDYTKITDTFVKIKNTILKGK